MHLHNDEQDHDPDDDGKPHGVRKSREQRQHFFNSRPIKDY